MVERTRTLNRRTFLGGAATFCVASFAVPSMAYAKSSSELKQEASDLQAQADEVSKELVNAQADLEAASDKYYKAQEDHQAATDAANKAQKKIDSATKQISQYHWNCKPQHCFHDRPPGQVVFHASASLS